MPFGFGGYGYGRRRGGGGKLRLIIAAVIALIGIITYFSRTEVNPVTGEKQRVAMTTEQEMALGLQAAPQMAQQMGGAVDPASDPEAALVAEVGQRLVQRSEASRSPYVQNFNFYLLNDSQTVNAFALPGGQIFITRALLDRLQHESQLAGVLGHEIGHVINRHGAEHMATGQLGQSLVTAFGIGAAEDLRSGYTAAMIASMVNGLVQLKYSREDEHESDSYGLKYMVEAGYDPSSMADVMRILKEASGGRGGGPDWTASHPNPDERVQQIQNWVKQTYPNGVPAELSKGRSL